VRVSVHKVAQLRAHTKAMQGSVRNYRTER